ncbi:MAG TPA: VOC family protein, partial [Casimicrobiaceae bacterium]|nr:VOC family protein [Casimicrobiaceae bacterium]
GSYTMIGVGEGVGGGMMADSTAPPNWLAYVGVDDVRAKTAQAKSLGAACCRTSWRSAISAP